MSIIKNMQPITAEARKILNSIPIIIDKAVPIPGRFRGALPSNVAELSRLLTGERGERSLSYLTRPNFLSAYLRYFLPWNLYRLCFLLPSLDIKLSPGDTIVDLGSGPLTFVLALWICRPDLRKMPLEFHCIDRSAAALEAGKKIFSGLVNADSVWKIKLIKDDIDTRKPPSKGCNAKLVCAINLFNEIYEKLPHNNTAGLQRMAANIANFLHGHTAANGLILTVEPGVPQSGYFISFLRSAFLELNRQLLSPCLHTTACPMSGGKKRWCHFSFEVPEIPKELYRISAAAKLPKDRLVLSYLFAGEANRSYQHNQEQMRVISDAFTLPNNRYGRYCCSDKGLVLMAGEKNRINKITSGSLAVPIYHEMRDEKSSALIAEVL